MLDLDRGESMNRIMFALAMMLAFNGVVGDAHAEMLITEQETALPAAAGGSLTFRGVTRGPKVDMVSPAAEAGVVKSPVDLKMKFQSFGGATIDPSSVKVTYLKTPLVDLTARMKKYIQAGGIEMSTAEMPAGDHPIRVEIKDSEGRTGGATFTLKVTK